MVRGSLLLYFILAVSLVLVVPGFLLMNFLPGCRSQPDGWYGTFSRLADSMALSVALSAVTGLWLAQAGIQLTGIGLLSIYGGLGLLLLGVTIWRTANPQAAAGTDRQSSLKSWLWVLALAVLFIAWRFYQARDLALPAWVDSVHHVLIVRKIMEYGAIPLNLEPYISVPFYYHYGFHLAAAQAATIARVSAAQSVLWLGQVINAGVAFSVFRFGSAFASDDAEQRRVVFRRALIAALLVGFALQMPAYYVTWGRYTLLTGLLLLGPTLAAALQFWRSPADLGAGLRFIILLAGIFVTHYLVALMVGLFLVVLGVMSLARFIKQLDWLLLPWLLVAASLLAVGLSFPWLWRVFEHNLTAARLDLILPIEGVSQQTATPEYWNYLIYLLGPRYNHILMAAAAVGMALSLRRGDLYPLIAWSFLLVLFSQPWGLRFGPFRPDLFIIVLFFPASLFLAELLVFVSHLAGRIRLRWLEPVVLTLATSLIIAWGMWQTRSVLNSATLFVETADVAALDWINQNIPQDARFYINSVRWQWSIYRGVDGGYWLAPYTGRGSLVPPAAYGWGTPDTVNRISDFARRAGQLTDCSDEFWSLVSDAGLTHVYVRQGSGNLQPMVLNQCRGLRQVYNRQGVFIYKISLPRRP